MASNFEEHPVCFVTKDYREIQFFDCISKVTITDELTNDTMDKLMRYQISAQLVNKRSV